MLRISVQMVGNVHLPRIYTIMSKATENLICFPYNNMNKSEVQR